MITTELLLVRHGEARCNRDGVVGGPKTCTGLSTLGQIQMERVAHSLKASAARAPIAALYAGPRRRLRESGEMLSAQLQLPLLIDDGLDGPDHGAADGKNWSAVKEEFGGGPHAHPELPWAQGSDTWSGYLQRATDNLRTLIARHEGERVLLACHGETVMAAYALLLGLAPTNAASFTVEHASLTWWQKERNRFGAERWLLRRHSDTTHRDHSATQEIG
jgi:2,3-bisphosphoglycerate-dependent phosphoglycerate mutase